MSSAEYIKNIQTYEIAYWPSCGYIMPYELNPKEMVRLGFKCIGSLTV